MPSPSRTSIYAALAGNVAVGVVKLVAWFLSGSSAMLVESIHSAIDTLNQGLLLFGLYRGARPADDRHPFGYGLETYFWTFVVALLILSFGGLASIWAGIERLRPFAQEAPEGLVQPVHPLQLRSRRLRGAGRGRGLDPGPRHRGLRRDGLRLAGHCSRRRDRGDRDRRAAD